MDWQKDFGFALTAFFTNVAVSWTFFKALRAGNDDVHKQSIRELLLRLVPGERTRESREQVVDLWVSNLKAVNLLLVNPRGSWFRVRLLEVWIWGFQTGLTTLMLVGYLIGREGEGQSAQLTANMASTLLFVAIAGFVLVVIGLFFLTVFTEAKNGLVSLALPHKFANTES